MLRQVETLRIYRQSTYEAGMFISPMHRPSLPPQEIPLALISVRAEATLEPECGGKDEVSEKSSFAIENRIRGIPTCSGML